MAQGCDALTDEELVELLVERAAVAAVSPAGTSQGRTVEAPVLAGGDRTKHDVAVPRESPVTVKLPPSARIYAEAYRPVESVWCGEEDAELIDRLLCFYPRDEPRLILDATVNGGRFWRGSDRPVIGLDIDPRHRPNVCADNAAMPFRSDCFDAVVYDPPHIPNQGRDRSKDFNARFGLGARSPKENGYNFSHTYPKFMGEAWRILKAEGILLCKIVDYVHNHRYQWAHIDLVIAGQRAGFTACDCIIKVRKGPIIDPKWKVAHHSRRQHCYWIVFRKSTRCE